MNITYYAYRDWAIEILEKLRQLKPWWNITHILPHKSNSKNSGSKFFSSSTNSNIKLFYGWSWMLPEEIYNNNVCLIMHLSPLPKYRGGSPIQHQIINGEKMSAVTILRVREKVDSGEIYSQTPFSLEGTLDEIFKRVVEIGVKDTIKVMDDLSRNIEPIPQDESKATYFKRRKPEESEIKLKDLKTKTARQLYDFIRALADPYPNAFIKCADGKKLYLTGAKLDA